MHEKTFRVRLAATAVAAAIIASTLAACGDGRAPRTTPAAGCDLPVPAGGDGGQIVLFGAYAGDAVSTATVVGQDEVTGTARVVIESGSGPLYLVLSSFNATVWRFEGEIARVARVVVVGPQMQGVTGIDRDRITFGRTVPSSEAPGTTANDATPSADASCFAPFYETGTREGDAARRFVESALGRSVDVFAGAYAVGTLSLPSAVVVPSATPPPPAGFDSALYDSATRFYPGGLVDIDPEDVVSEDAPESYDVFPSQMGLSQLVGTGAIELRGDDFYISRPVVRFPAGLFGAHAVRFVLGRGMPLPPGDPGHSCVISEETGLPLGGTSCAPRE